MGFSENEILNRPRQVNGIGKLQCSLSRIRSACLILVTQASGDSEFLLCFTSTDIESKLLFYKVMKSYLSYKHAQTHTNLPSLGKRQSQLFLPGILVLMAKHAPFEVESTSADLHFANFALFL